MMSFIINISSGSVSQCTVASGIVWRRGSVFISICTQLKMSEGTFTHCCINQSQLNVRDIS